MKIKTIALLGLSLVLSSPLVRAQEIINVSYDPTRELYAELNPLFAAKWKAETGRSLQVKASHGGSGKQARAVADGLPADVVTLALGHDIDMLAERGRLLPKDWQQRLPDNSSPYTSTIVFVVRSGNPRNIRDWEDLVRPGVSVITPNPKTSGGARWNYLAAWAWAQRKFAGDEPRIRDYMTRLFRNVPVLDTGARGSTTTFVQRGIGDVFISWENEAHLALKEYPDARLQIVNPSLSILAEPPVAWVDRNTKRRGSEQAARAYLEFLYSPEGQDIIGRHFYRPRLKAAQEKYQAQFGPLELVTIQEFGGWSKAQSAHFAEGGIFDQISKTSR